MKLALGCIIRLETRDSLEFLAGRVGSTVSIVEDGRHGGLLVIGPEVPSFEVGCHLIEEAQRKLRGYIAGQLDIYVGVDDGKGGTHFIHQNEYTVICERRATDGRHAVDELTRQYITS
jgi:hypothetical protein